MQPWDRRTGVGIEVANWFIERKVAVAGGDSCCVEVRGPLPKEGVHHVLFLGHGSPVLENLDLAELARDGATEFLFLGLPERIKGANGITAEPHCRALRPDGESALMAAYCR